MKNSYYQLHLLEKYIDETRAFRRLIGIADERDLANEEQVILYAEYAFLIKYANDDNSFNEEIELNRWLRLISNLVKPTLNLQLDSFFRMIRSDWLKMGRHENVTVTWLHS